MKRILELLPSFNSEEQNSLRISLVLSKKYLKTARVLRYKSDETIFESYSEPNLFYLVLKGSVKLYDE